MEINFDQLTPQGSKKKGPAKPTYAIKFVRNNSVKNPYERVAFSTQAMDKYGFTNGNGLQFYGVVSGKLLVATCPEEQAKKMHGARGDNKVQYFKYDQFNTDLVEQGFVPKEEDCEVGLEFTSIDVPGSPNTYQFYTVSSIAGEEVPQNEIPEGNQQQEEEESPFKEESDLIGTDTQGSDFDIDPEDLEDIGDVDNITEDYHKSSDLSNGDF